MTVTSYSIESPQNGEVPAPPTSPTSEFLAQCVSTIKLTTESEPCCLYPTQGNIHKIQAAEYVGGEGGREGGRGGGQVGRWYVMVGIEVCMVGISVCMVGIDVCMVGVDV